MDGRSGDCKFNCRETTTESNFESIEGKQLGNLNDVVYASADCTASQEQCNDPVQTENLDDVKYVHECHVMISNVNVTR